MSIQQILCLCVLVLMYALIISGKYTIAIPASVGAIAMVMIGVLDLKSLFTQYCSDTIAIMLGMMILG